MMKELAKEHLYMTHGLGQQYENRLKKGRREVWGWVKEERAGTTVTA